MNNKKKKQTTSSFGRLVFPCFFVEFDAFWKYLPYNIFWTRGNFSTHHSIAVATPSATKKNLWKKWKKIEESLLTIYNLPSDKEDKRSTEKKVLLVNGQCLSRTYILEVFWKFEMEESVIYQNLVPKSAFLWPNLKPLLPWRDFQHI